MIDDCNINNLAKNQVSAVFNFNNLIWIDNRVSLLTICVPESDPLIRYVDMVSLMIDNLLRMSLRNKLFPFKSYVTWRIFPASRSRGDFVITN